MSVTVCIAANTIDVPQAGGHRWVYLNWALGARALGCRIIWLEGVKPDAPVDTVRANLTALQHQLAPYELGDSVALYAKPWSSERVPWPGLDVSMNLDVAEGADVLLNLAYDIPRDVVDRFRRSALIDIDPGLTQIWISECQMRIAPHDVYFTIGETVGQPGALFPDCGVRWHYTPPPVFLPAWPPAVADSTAPYTTITNWWEGWVVFREESYANRKRDGFLPFLDLPKRTSQPLELAICLATGDPEEGTMLLQRGWRVRDATAVASTPWRYQHYIQGSFGEFSCAKPSCVRLQNAWISDRTLCYLASGKPAVVQHTGPSHFLPDRAGLFRFRGVEEAADCLETVVADYEHQCDLARGLAEEHFDARKVVARVLERALA